MLKGLKKPQVLHALMIALSVPFLTGYLLYCDGAEDERYDPEAQCENEDLDDLFTVPDCQSQLAFSESIESNPLFSVLLPDALFPVFLPETNAIEQVSPFSSLSPRLEQKTLVLRC